MKGNDVMTVEETAHKPAAFHSGLLQVYVTGRKYALQEEETFDFIYTHAT